MAGGEAELGAVFGAGPVEHGVPELGADALTADGAIGDEIFEIGDSMDDGPHDDAESGDADDFASVVDGEEHIVIVGGDEIVEPFLGDFAAVFTAAG